MTRRRVDAGAAVAALGAVLLLVSLFLDWYGDDEDGISAWRVFEVLDLVLAVVSLLAVSTFLRRIGADRRLPDAPFLLLGAIALVVVSSQLVNDPPRVAGLDPSLEIGAWLALAGAAVLLAGALMSVARVSLALSVERRTPPAAAPPHSAAETETVKLTEHDRPA
jgi:hypothetical protein